MMKLKEAIAASKAFLFRRQTAYTRLFHGPVADEVLRDLAKFCRAHTSTFHTDPRVSAQLDGRREVWLRITDHLNLMPDELWKKYGRPDLD
jgi:hypothetical protein